VKYNLFHITKIIINAALRSYEHSKIVYSFDFFVYYNFLGYFWSPYPRPHDACVHSMVDITSTHGGAKGGVGRAMFRRLTGIVSKQNNDLAVAGKVI
jgi:hypothetical protein